MVVRLDTLNAANPGNRGHGTIPSPKGMGRDVEGTQWLRVAKPAWQLEISTMRLEQLR